MNTTVAMLLWGGLTLFFLLLEALTPQLLSIWFAVGAFAALLTSVFLENFFVQLVVFLLVTTVVVVAMRPLSKKFKSLSAEHMNANRILGRHAIVTVKIDNDAASGQIRVDRAVWSAKSVDGKTVEEGARVKVVKIEGVKAVVRLSRVQPEAEDVAAEDASAAEENSAE